MSKFKKLHINQNDYLAYNKFSPGKKSKKTGVIFLSGFMSDMEGSKATFLEEICRGENIPYIRFDYSGCGESSGEFEDQNISSWKENVLKVIDSFSEVENVILVGSSMGGWLMLLAAIERLERIYSLIGIASAPDFTENLIWQTLSKEAKDEIISQGKYKMPTDYCDDPNSEEDNYYIITKNLIEDGRKNMLLDKGKININIPVKLIHGVCDEDVPYSYSLKLMEQLKTENVEVILKKNGKHRMSDQDDLDLIEETLKRSFDG